MSDENPTPFELSIALDEALNRWRRKKTPDGSRLDGVPRYVMARDLAGSVFPASEETILREARKAGVGKTAQAAQGPFGALVRFLLLTATRRSEAAGLRWSEIDGTDWALPAARNKTKVDLIRPLSAAAQGVLASIQRVGDVDLVFTTDGERPIGGFSKFKSAFDKTCGVRS